MKRLISFVSLVCISMLANGVAWCAPEKGVQAVLLHCWSATSTKNLVNVLKQYPGREIEVAFAPNVAHTVSHPYRNIKAVINGLPNKRVHVVVYLGFHSNGKAVTGLENFVRFFNEYKGKAQIVVSPSLEDWTTVANINAAAKTIAKAVGGKSINKLILRRSPDGANALDHKEPSRAVVVNGKTFKFRGIDLEEHGVVGARLLEDVDVYSNDGVFVYDSSIRLRLADSTLEGSSSFASVGTDTTYSIADFKRDIDGSRTNLWRPAYNMFRAPDGGYWSKKERTFNDGKSLAFDGREAEVLKKFLGMR